MRDRWRDGEQRDIAHDMMHLTLNVVAGTLFATDLRNEVDEFADAINRIMGLYNFLVMLPAAEWLVHVRPPGLAAFVRARKRIDAVVYRMIEAHRKAGHNGGSLLDLMLAASPTIAPLRNSRCAIRSSRFFWRVTRRSPTRSRGRGICSRRIRNANADSTTKSIVNCKAVHRHLRTCHDCATPRWFWLSPCGFTRQRGRWAVTRATIFASVNFSCRRRRRC